jgi:hypothetical protein
VLRSQRRTSGTRFNLFPSYAEGYAEPELAEVSLPAGMIEPGPADPWMYTVSPISKDVPYDPPSYMPPYRGSTYAPALPTSAGHFDRIEFGTVQFLAAHTYGTVRLVLDIWERLLGRRITWWHAPAIPRLELIPIVHWPNAQSGPGFIEMGQEPDQYGRLQPFCLNFDVLAHETGHAILFSQVGTAGSVSVPFLAFHESFADLMSMIAVLHFPSVQTRLLHQTWGDLYSLNVLTRFGEFSDTQQIRIASNQTKMSDVEQIHLAPDGSWVDPAGQNRNQHAIAEPLTGAIFSCFVEIYQDELLARRLISPDADVRGWRREEVELSMTQVHSETGQALQRFASGFYGALAVARLAVGRCMAHVIRTVRPDTLTFDRVAARFLEEAVALGHRRNLPALLDHFVWRGIDPRPFLAIDAPMHHGVGKREQRGQLRMIEVANHTLGCRCHERYGFVDANRLMLHPHRMANIRAG